VRCHARLADGSRQCRAWSVAGCFTCQSHGSMTRSAREAGRRRLAEAAAIERTTAAGLDPEFVHAMLSEAAFKVMVRRLVKAAREQAGAGAAPGAGARAEAGVCAGPARKRVRRLPVCSPPG
jgi:hypothetical protein